MLECLFEMKAGFGKYKYLLRNREHSIVDEVLREFYTSSFTTEIGHSMT
jgi:hypothetical protein